MRNSNVVVGSWIVVAFALGAIQAEEPPPGTRGALREIEGVKVGERLLVGERAPDFEVPVEFGGPLRLSSFRGKKDVILVFYRAHW